LGGKSQALWLRVLWVLTTSTLTLVPGNMLIGSVGTIFIVKVAILSIAACLMVDT
jgi:hypothetical protein